MLLLTGTAAMTMHHTAIGLTRRLFLRLVTRLPQPVAVRGLRYQYGPVREVSRSLFADAKA